MIKNTNNIPTIDESVAVTGAIPLWDRIIRQTLTGAEHWLPPGSQIIEIGFGDAILTCYLARRFGWNIMGYESSQRAYEQGKSNVERFGAEKSVQLHKILPEDTWKLQGQFDGVFIKTVLYNAKNLKEYGSWLDWVLSVIKPGGYFINFENGKTNLLTQLYRRLRKRYYTDLSLYDDNIHELYKGKFELLRVGHYGSLSQFIAPFRIPFLFLSTIEEKFFTRTPTNSFITAIVAKKTAKQ